MRRSTSDELNYSFWSQELGARNVNVGEQCGVEVLWGAVQNLYMVWFSSSVHRSSIDQPRSHHLFNLNGFYVEEKEIRLIFRKLIG